MCVYTGDKMATREGLRKQGVAGRLGGQPGNLTGTELTWDTSVPYERWSLDAGPGCQTASQWDLTMLAVHVHEDQVRESQPFLGLGSLMSSWFRFSRYGSNMPVYTESPFTQ